MTRENGILKFYVNGEQTSKTSSSTYFSPPSLNLGGVPTLKIGAVDGCGFFNGSIDEVMIFNSSLSASEVSSLFENQRTRLIIPSSNPNPVNGACGTTLNNCTRGSLQVLFQNETHYRWACNSDNGGTNSSCSFPLPPSTNYFELNAPFLAQTSNIYTNRVELVIKNNGTDNYAINNITIAGCGSAIINQKLDSGLNDTYTVNCYTSLIAGQYLRGDILIIYKRITNNIILIGTGTIVGIVKPQNSAMCIDSDGGLNYFVKNITTGLTFTGGMHTIEDGCIIGGINDGWLRETFCDENNVATWTDFNCPNGCFDGACKASASNIDIIKIERTADKLNLGDSIRDMFANLDDSELPNYLKDDVYVSDINDEFDYEQSIGLGNLFLRNFSDIDYKNGQYTPGIRVNSGENILNYTLDFTDNPESGISNGHLINFETTKLSFAGKKWFITSARNSSTPLYLGEFTFIDASYALTLSEGNSGGMLINGKTYNIVVNRVDSSSVSVTVNGEITNSLNSGQVFRLSDGKYLSVLDIYYDSRPNGISSAEVSIGDGKLTINSGLNVNLNDQVLPGLKGYVFRGFSFNGRDAIGKIVIEWNAPEKTFIVENSRVSIPGLDNIWFDFKGMTYDSDELYGNLYLNGKYEFSPGPPPQIQVCQEVIDKKSILFNNFGDYLLNESDSGKGDYFGDNYTQSYALYINSSNVNEAMLVQSIVFDNKKVNETQFFNDEILADSFWETREIIVNPLTMQKEKVYVVSGSESSESLSYFWYNENVFMYVIFGRIGTVKDINDIEQFIGNIKDNRFGREEFSSAYIYLLDSLSPKILSSCSSKVIEECNPYWEKRIEPVVCPEYGYQQVTLRDKYSCTSNSILEYPQYCSPGICSGCYVPRWFGYDNGDNVCIPYGTRLEKADQETVRQKLDAEVGSGQPGSETLTIISDSEAIVTFYGEVENRTYNLDEGATVGITLPDSGKYIEWKIREVNAAEGFVDIEISTLKVFNGYCKYDGNVYEQMGDDASCQNDYECTSGECNSGQCVNTYVRTVKNAGLLVKILCKLDTLFDGDVEYLKCLQEYQ